MADLALVVSSTPALSLEAAKGQRQELMNYIKSFLVEGVDFGKVPGTDKDCLFKPGAEKLSSFLGLRPDFIELEAVQDWTGEQHGNEPFFSYRYKCELYKGEYIVGQGIGSCNSWEKKYRWRWVDESDLPFNVNPDKCQQRRSRIVEPVFAVEKKETTGKYGKPLSYWEAFETAIQDGNATRTTKKKANGDPMDAWMIESASYRVPNEDVYTQVNTVDKMAQKRALVAAVLVAANVSELFTQDMEDLVYDMPAVIVEQPAETTQPSKPAKQPEPVQELEYIEVGTTGNAVQDFWAYQRANGIDKAIAQDILREADNDFSLGLERLQTYKAQNTPPETTAKQDIENAFPRDADGNPVLVDVPESETPVVYE